MTYITIVPAYGKDYKSKREVLEAWNAGTDFRIASIGPDDGRYISKREVPAGTHIMARYRKLTMITEVTKP